MKKTRFSEEQMVKILREADKAPVSEVAKKHGVSDVTIYAWRKRFGQLEELVGAAVYLASDASSFVTGQLLAVDGGFLASGVNQ